MQELPLPATGPAALDRRPSRRRVALLVAPWALAAVLAAAAVGSRMLTRPALPGPDPTPAQLVATTDASPPPAPAPAETATSPDLAGADLLAVLGAARRGLGTAGLPDGDGPRPDRWPLETVVADVTPFTEQLHVATVHALVITAQDGGWSAPTTAAVAVPLVRSDARFHVAGTPWPLPPPPASSALLDLGWRVDEVETVELLDGAVLALQVRGTPPDGPPGTHRVWLLDAPGGARPTP
jgi:hypothetical protein